MKFTTEQIEHVRQLITKHLTLNDKSHCDRIIAELSPPAYIPTAGQVYAFKYGDNGDWGYNRWPGCSVTPVSSDTAIRGITRRPLTLSERGLI